MTQTAVAVMPIRRKRVAGVRRRDLDVSMLESRTSDHERYLRDMLISKVHGIDTTQQPPPARQVAEIAT